MDRFRFSLDHISWFIARRYLFAHKRYNVINIVSTVALGAIAIVTMALVCILSIYNGYQELILRNTNLLDPPLLLKEENNQIFDRADLHLTSLLHHPAIASVSGVLTTKGLVHSGSNQIVCNLQGVEPSFLQICKAKRWHTDGTPLLNIGQFYVGANVASALQLLPESDLDTLSVVLPNRIGYFNPIVPAISFRTAKGNITSVVRTDNEEYDNTLFLNLTQLQELQSYNRNEVQALALGLNSSYSTEAAKSLLMDLLPAGFVLLDQTEQHPEIVRLVAIEKWITFLILFFVLLLAAFNVVAGISMLMIEKQADTVTLRALGATPSTVARIFRQEGMLIVLSGIFIGLLLGIAVCYTQIEWEWLTTYTSQGAQAYPIRIQWLDLLFITISVMGIGYLSSVYPVCILSKKYYR